MGGFFMNEPMSFQNSPRVCIHYKHRMPARVQQHRIRRLRANSVHPQQLLPKLIGRNAKHFCQAARIVLPQEFHERLQLSRLLPEVSRRANQPCQLSLRHPLDPQWRQPSFAAQRHNSTLHVAPRRILRQYRADYNLEPRSPWPPALRSMLLKKCIVIIMQNWQHRLRRRQNRRVRTSSFANAAYSTTLRNPQFARLQHLFGKINRANQPSQEIGSVLASSGLFPRTGISEFTTVLQIRPTPYQGVCYVGDGYMVSRESCGCPSVWARFY